MIDPWYWTTAFLPEEQCSFFHNWSLGDGISSSFPFSGLKSNFYICSHFSSISLDRYGSWWFRVVFHYTPAALKLPVRGSLSMNSVSNFFSYFYFASSFGVSLIYIVMGSLVDSADYRDSILSVRCLFLFLSWASANGLVPAGLPNLDLY